MFLVIKDYCVVTYPMRTKLKWKSLKFCFWGDSFFSYFLFIFLKGFSKLVADYLFGFVAKLLLENHASVQSVKNVIRVFTLIDETLKKFFLISQSKFRRKDVNRQLACFLIAH
jgi:hypothetical protein